MKTNEKLYVVYLLENGKSQTHGGPYVQDKAREVRDAMKKHVSNDQYREWRIPEDTVHVVAVTKDRFWDIEKTLMGNNT